MQEKKNACWNMSSSKHRGSFLRRLLRVGFKGLTESTGDREPGLEEEVQEEHDQWELRILVTGQTEDDISDTVGSPFSKDGEAGEDK